MSLSRFCIFCWCKICQRWYLRLYSTCKYKFKTHLSFGWIRQYTSPIFYSLQTYSSLSSFDESNTSPVRLISLSIQIHFRKMILSDFPQVYQRNGSCLKLPSMQYANPKLQLNCYLFVGLQLISLGSTSARVRPTPHCFGPAVVNMQREVYLIYRVLSSINCRGHWRDTKSKRHIFWRGNTWDSRHYVISFCGLYLKCDHKLTFHLTELIVFF